MAAYSFGTRLTRAGKRDREIERRTLDAPVPDELVRGVLTRQKAELAGSMMVAGRHPRAIANALQVPLATLKPVLWPDTPAMAQESPDDGYDHEACVMHMLEEGR